MRTFLKHAFPALLAALLLAGCAPRSRDFIPTGAAMNLTPTDPAHIRVLDSVPRGMIIGTVLVDRSKAKNTQEIIDMARLKAAAAGGDFIVWEDSLGTLPSATPAPGGPAIPPSNTGGLGHTTAGLDGPLPESTAEKTPKARFTVGIFLSESSAPQAQ